ncbi:MAG: bifunctional pyr operon transcriptional regulator/uracil phosphoribosyltransferase PyrR [Planctomycetota bacterium]
MPKDKQLLSQNDIDQTLVRIAGNIISNHSSAILRCSESTEWRRTAKESNSLVLIGIHRRGVPLARRLKTLIEKKIKSELLLGTLDITLYRDDLDTVGHLPIVKNTDIPFDLTGKSVVLVDDVLFTGRTIRSALNELAEFGRPKRIQLAVLIDRGHRELPICADYVGKAVQTKEDEVVKVSLKETDGTDEVVITVKTKAKV